MSSSKVNRGEFFFAKTYKIMVVYIIIASSYAVPIVTGKHHSASCQLLGTHRAP